MRLNSGPIAEVILERSPDKIEAQQFSGCWTAGWPMSKRLRLISEPRWRSAKLRSASLLDLSSCCCSKMEGLDLANLLPKMALPIPAPALIRISQGKAGAGIGSAI